MSARKKKLRPVKTTASPGATILELARQMYPDLIFVMITIDNNKPDNQFELVSNTEDTWEVIKSAIDHHERTGEDPHREAIPKI